MRTFKKNKRPLYILAAIIFGAMLLFLMVVSLLYAIVTLIFWIFHFSEPSGQVFFYCLTTPLALFFGWHISDWVKSLYREIEMMQDGRKYW